MELGSIFNPLSELPLLFHHILLMEYIMVSHAVLKLYIALEDEDLIATEDGDVKAPSSLKGAFASKLAATRRAARSSHQKKPPQKTATELGSDYNSDKQKQWTATKVMFSDSMQKMKDLNNILLDGQRKKEKPEFFC